MTDTPLSADQTSSSCFTTHRSVGSRFLLSEFVCAASCNSSISSRHFLKASPLRNNQELLAARLLIKTCPPNTARLLDVVKVFSSTRLPGFTGLDFLTTTGSSATSHRVGRSLEFPLAISLPTLQIFQCSRRTMPGFPSYCADSLLTIPSSSTLGVCLRIGLRAILHTYPHRAPNQVH